MEVLQVPSELVQMVALYREVNPKRVLEIGSWQGGTLQVWLTEAKPEAVVAVDLDHQNPSAYEGWRQQGTALYVVEGDSHDPAIAAAVRRGGPYNWMFIDGDHTEEGVRADVELAISCAAPGALLVLHDVALGRENIGDPGPRVIFDELRVSRDHQEFIEDPYDGPWAHGIGVVYL